MKSESIGLLLRFTSIGISFGMWQHSFVAGVFAYFVAITLERNEK